jgi:hypothetical protein
MLIVEQSLGFDPSWFHIGYGIFQSPDGRRFYRNLLGSWSETRQSREGQRWPDPRGFQNPQNLSHASRSPVSREPTKKSEISDIVDLAHLVNDRLDKRFPRKIASSNGEPLLDDLGNHPSAKTSSISIKLLEIINQAGSIPDHFFIRDILLDPMVKHYDRQSPALHYVVSHDPSHYKEGTIERMHSALLSSRNIKKAGLYIYNIDKCLLSGELADIMGVPPDEWSAEHWFSLSVFIHEHLHSTKTSQRLTAYESHIKKLFIYRSGNLDGNFHNLRKVLEEGLAEYITRSIIAGMIDDDEVYSDSVNRFSSHAYKKFTDAVHLMATHGGLDIDSAWRDTSVVGNTLGMFIQMRNAQSTAVENILRSADVEEKKISEVLDLIDDLWTKGGFALSIKNILPDLYQIIANNERGDLYVFNVDKLIIRLKDAIQFGN